MQVQIARDDSVAYHARDHDKHALRAHVSSQLQLTLSARTSQLSIVQRAFVDIRLCQPNTRVPEAPRARKQATRVGAHPLRVAKDQVARHLGAVGEPCNPCKPERDPVALLLLALTYTSDASSDCTC